jgi:glucan 1,3-beta-glucosidase
LQQLLTERRDLLGAWLEIETSNTPNIFLDAGYNVTDEWTFCQEAGFEYCGKVLEEHYATWYTTADIDKIATVGVNIIRIPTTYAAWIVVPGSFLYHGNQVEYLRNISEYAIKTYGMHVIVELHSLPGKLPVVLVSFRSTYQPPCLT